MKVFERIDDGTSTEIEVSPETHIPARVLSTGRVKSVIFVSSDDSMTSWSLTND